jgi:hypothetical protein
MRTILLVTGLLTGLVVMVAVFGVDEGEVVNLTTVDADGALFDTQLWIVDIDGTGWLRAGRPVAHWLARVRAHPAVEVKRGESVGLYTAVPVDDATMRERVNRAMAEKYGTADRMTSRFLDPRRSVPIRLDPRAGDPLPRKTGAH